MKFAIVEHQKMEPFKGGLGTCVGCGSIMIAKCGSQKLWHWAHKSLQHCDTWWENETEWHRNWKAKFPKEMQEIPARDKQTGELHIADVITEAGFTLEFQNSPMSIEEAVSREQFHNKMVWVVNGDKFLKNIEWMHILPAANCGVDADIRFMSMSRPTNDLGEAIWFRVAPDHKENDMVMIQRVRDEPGLRQKIEAAYRGDIIVNWKRPILVWVKSSVPVYFDFGIKGLWKLKIDHPHAPKNFVLKRISEEEFMSNVGARTLNQ